MVNSIRQSIHPVGNTTITDKSSVQSKDGTRDMRPLAFAVPATIDSYEKQRFFVGAAEGGGRGRLTLFLFVLSCGRRAVHIEAMRCSAYKVARYQALCYTNERTKRELRTEGGQT